MSDELFRYRKIEGPTRLGFSIDIDGWEPADRPGLVINRNLDSNGWIVSHAASGLSVGHGSLPTFDAACAYLDALRPLADWRGDRPALHVTLKGNMARVEEVTVAHGLSLKTPEDG